MQEILPLSNGDCFGEEGVQEVGLQGDEGGGVVSLVQRVMSAMSRDWLRRVRSWMRGLRRR